MKRNVIIAPDEYYHIYNRGVGKQIIFHQTNDYLRFIFLLCHFQFTDTIPHLSRAIGNFQEDLSRLGQHPVLAKRGKRIVDLVAFCVMPNHFHIIVKESLEGGIPTYMQRVLNAYAKYYNTKYERAGHLFQGPYQAVHISNNHQMLYLSAYLHRNPREMSDWFHKSEHYPWSTYQDYVLDNRWGQFIVPEIIISQFANKRKYKYFVDTSIAKLLDGETEGMVYLRET